MAERLPPGTYDAEGMAPVYPRTGLESNGILYADSNSESHSRSNSITTTSLLASSSLGVDSIVSNGIHSYNPRSPRESSRSSDGHSDIPRLPIGEERLRPTTPNGSELVDGDNNSVRSRNSALASGDSGSSLVEAEWNEQYEPGVYITLVTFRDGTRDLKRVRFRYLNFLHLSC